MTKPIKLLLVDDHHILLVGLSTLLQKYADIEVIAMATNGKQGVQLTKEKKPDVVLMDIQMSEMDGLEATKMILEHDPSVRILVLTACHDEVFPIRLLKAGTCGYITKNCKADEVANAIRTVHAGERYIAPAIAQKLALSRFPIGHATPFDSLSERERQVVCMIALDAKKVSDIAVELDLSPKTVNTYRYRIFEKLGVTNDIKLTHLVLRYGIVNQRIKKQVVDRHAME